MALRKDLIEKLQYIKNTGGNVTIEGFDDDWDPIGPMLRKELMPEYIIEGPNCRLQLTTAGHEELSANG